MPSIHHKAPNLSGPDSAAWKRSSVGNSVVTLDTWVVYAKWAHPFWPYHAIGMVALRDLPGHPPAFIRTKGATHEIFVTALNPDHEPTLSGPLHHLEPINFTAQLTLASDEAANSILHHTVEEVVAGLLNPDTDGIRGWIVRFGLDGIKDTLKPGYESTLRQITPKKGTH